MRGLHFIGFALGASLATQAAAEDVRFVTCPIYRDTDSGRKSGCWLADDPVTGVRYDVSQSMARPHWAYGVLVEGNVSEDTEDTCGGIRLLPVRTSVLYDMECPRHMIAAEGYPGRPLPFAERYVMPVFVERDLPEPPYEDTTFSLVYDWNDDFITYNHSDYFFDIAALWIEAAQPVRVVVTGWADTDPVEISGRTMAEDPDIARRRAEIVHESLLRRGVPDEKIEVRWETGAQPADIEAADGLTESSRRRVDITGIME